MKARTTRGYSIKFALNALLIASIAATALGVGIFTYLNAKSSIELLWAELSDRIANLAIEKTLRYLETGPSALATNRETLNAGFIDPSDREGMLRFLLVGIRAHPNVTWYSFGGADGVYLSAYRAPDDELHLTWREQIGENTRFRVFRVTESNEWAVVRDNLGEYDPRTRPWWNAALEHEGPTWVEPFLFATTLQPGFMIVQQHRNENGELLGVWAIEYEMSYLSEFLAKMTVVRNGRVYLITDGGEVIGHPDGWTTTEVDGVPVVASAENHRDLLLADSYLEAKSRGAGGQNFELDLDGRRYMAVYQPFPESSGLDWNVGIVVPETDLLSRIHRNNRTTAIVAALVALSTILIGAWVTARVSRPLNAIAGELDRIGRLEFDVKLSGDLEAASSKSRVREVISMMDARDRMKGGLSSFSKYVPADLVRNLMRSGQEAALGVELKELTVFFADIADFTAISENLDPAILSESLGSYLEEMSTIISRANGTVDKYIGDAIMAFWGAPVDVRNHAESACLAALEYQALLTTLRNTWTEHNLPPFEARIGINTGPVLVGNIGSERRMNYTVIGDTVNVASRLEGLCKLYRIEIAIGERTREMASDCILARPIDRVAVMGRAQGEVIYELMGSIIDATETQANLADATTRAFEAYQAGAFEKARSALLEALRIAPDDGPANRLLERCEELIECPPGDDWNGITILTNK